MSRTEYHRLYFRAYRSKHFHLVPDMPLKVCGRKPRATREQYKLIRIRRAGGASLRELAEDYDYTIGGISRICRHGIKHHEATPSQRTQPELGPL